MVSTPFVNGGVPRACPLLFNGAKFAPLSKPRMSAHAPPGKAKTRPAKQATRATEDFFMIKALIIKFPKGCRPGRWTDPTRNSVHIHEWSVDSAAGRTRTSRSQHAPP